MWGGFARDVVNHVVSKYRKALDRDIGSHEHMRFLKKQRTRSAYTLPLEVIQNLLEANNNLLQTYKDINGKRGSTMLELAIRQGYRTDVLAHILRFGPKDINSLHLRNTDGPTLELGDEQIKAIQVLLSQLRFLECHLSWTGEAEALLLHHIAESCKLGNNLESLSLSLSLTSFYYSEIVRRMLRCVA